MSRIQQTFKRTDCNHVFESEAYTDDGKVWRWVANDHTVPLDAAEEYGIPIDRDAQAAAREEELAKFVEAYRRNYTGPSDEERAEARAAHGPGVELVNVITGHRWRT